MIQVLQRAFSSIELLAERGRLGLKELSERTGVHKTTLCNILKTLVALGYVQKADAGAYELGDKFLFVANPWIGRNAVQAVAAGYAQVLTDLTGASVAVSILHNGRMYIVAFTRKYDIGANPATWRKNSLYGTATGRVLLAYLDDADLRGIAARKGLYREEDRDPPSADEVAATLREVRGRRIYLKPSDDGSVISAATPVYGPDGKVWAAICAHIPAGRFRGRAKAEALRNVERVADRMSAAIAEHVRSGPVPDGRAPADPESKGDGTCSRPAGSSSTRDRSPRRTSRASPRRPRRPASRT